MEIEIEAEALSWCIIAATIEVIWNTRYMLTAVTLWSDWCCILVSYPVEDLTANDGDKNIE